MTSNINQKRASVNYGAVFVVLAIFTALEVGIAYISGLPMGVKLGALVFSASAKVLLVALYFMHLRYDSRTYAIPLILGAVLLIPIMLILGLTMTTVAAGPETTTLEATGQVISVEEVSFNLHMSQTTAEAGPVTFHVVNGAGDMLHEFIIFQTDIPADQLPTNMMGRVVEEAMTIVAAAEDIPPAGSRNITVNLGPGHYVMVCNLPGHYLQGMRVDFEVTGESMQPTTVPESTADPTAAAGGM